MTFSKAQRHTNILARALRRVSARTTFYTRAAEFAMPPQKKQKKAEFPALVALQAAIGSKDVHAAMEALDQAATDGNGKPSRRHPCPDRIPSIV